MLLVIWGSATTKMFVTACKFLSFSAEFISDVIRLSKRGFKKKKKNRRYPWNANFSSGKSTGFIMHFISVMECLFSRKNNCVVSRFSRATGPLTMLQNFAIRRTGNAKASSDCQLCPLEPNFN